MVDKKYKDFDAAVNEADGEPIKFKIAGNEYELPGQLPARVVLTQMRYMDESGAMDAYIAWAIGMAAWIYIIYEIWIGDAKKAAGEASEGVQFAFTWMTYILTFGWAIYPAGYILGIDASADNQDMLNIVYNIADVVNKTAFGLMVWYAATIDTAAAESKE